MQITFFRYHLWAHEACLPLADSESNKRFDTKSFIVETNAMNISASCIHLRLVSSYAKSNCTWVVLTLCKFFAVKVDAMNGCVCVYVSCKTSIEFSVEERYPGVVQNLKFFIMAFISHDFMIEYAIICKFYF